MFNTIDEIKRFIHLVTDFEIVSFLLEKGIYGNSVNCRHCLYTMKLKISKYCVDGFVWQCRNYNCSHFQTTKKLCVGSIFDGMRVSFGILLRLTLYGELVQQIQSS